MQKRARLIAFYLPQFHPIPENDAWWGKGFTEWTNVARARPLFRGHHQPNVPADLGFYDLRVPETRAAQAELARQHGIEAFCYYHYWFGGKRLLEKPFEAVLESGEPDFPFCLCWANETWSGIWHGAPDRILVKQEYPGMEDHRAHFLYLLRAFRDERYVTVDGKPLFLVYNPTQIPEVRRVTDLWREMASRAGLKGLHLVGVHGFQWVPREYGFDASTSPSLPSPGAPVSWRYPVRKMLQRYRRLTKQPAVYRYQEVARHMLKDVADPRIVNYPCFIPNWDNTPRSAGNGRVLQGSTPELARLVLREAIRVASKYPPEHRIVFVKSWNEWAEGNYLEPDLRFGRGYLGAVRDEVFIRPADLG